MSPAPDGGYDLVAEGSLGHGSGHERAGGGGLVLELANARKGWFVPFDTIRIRQGRPSVEGRVQETVELLSKKKGREVPFMKIEEEGLVYRPVHEEVRATPSLERLKKGLCGRTVTLSALPSDRTVTARRGRAGLCDECYRRAMTPPLLRRS